jgi:HPt (histidine-containing phosphotransfer) domain-containing protein
MDDDFLAALAGLKREYRQALPEKILKINALMDSLIAGAGGVPGLKELERTLHTLAGSGLTFGLPELSSTAAAAEAWLEPWCQREEVPGTVDLLCLRALVAAVEASAA